MNTREAVLHFKNTVDIEKFAFLVVADVSESIGFGLLEETYGDVRDKICEIQVARALSRPPPDGHKTQKPLVVKANQVVSELGGISTLPAPLAMLMNKVADGK